MAKGRAGPAVLVEGPAKSFGQLHALRGIGLVVPRGAVLGLRRRPHGGRLRSMPLARSAVLAEPLAADTGRMPVTILIVAGAGYAAGFRFVNGAARAILMIVLATASGLSVCLTSALTAWLHALRRQPSRHLRHRRHASAGARRDPGRVRPARRPSLQAGQLTSRRTPPALTREATT